MLIWHNRAAPLFHGTSRRRGGTGEIVPLKGQIARLIRLGSPNRASLSRMQFLVDDRPVSATCACMPLSLDDGAPALLVVAVDPVDGDALAGLPAHDPLVESLLPPETAYLLLAPNGTPLASSGAAAAMLLPAIQNEDAAAFDAEGNGRIDTATGPLPVLRLTASPRGATLLLADVPAAEAAQPAETPVAEPPAIIEAPAAPILAEEPLLPLGLPPAPTSAAAAAPEPAEVTQAPATRGLTSLFDRLMDDRALFTPLGPEEEFAPRATPSEAAAGEPAEAAPAAESAPPQPIAPAPAEEQLSAPPDSDAVAAASSEPTEPEPAPAVEMPSAAAFAQAPAMAELAAEPMAEPASPLVTASVDEPVVEQPADSTAQEPAEAPPPAPFGSDVLVLAATATEPPSPDVEAVERASRYNFDELSRILNDRIGNGDTESARTAVFSARPPAIPSATPTGELVTLGGETLVLNRLPLGILVFRDQQILFANRAITTMTGYESVEALRGAGLASIFPAGNETQAAGPVNHLIQRDGTLVPVTARLQSVSWQGKPALMLSASATEVRTGHEAAVKAFAEHLASARADGFLETSRAGVINYVSGDARLLLKRSEDQVLGRPISALTAPDEMPALKQFLERPARFAETARPAITLKGADPGIEIMLFALGQAGLVNGYFGFVRQGGERPLPALAGPPSEADPALLTRLSRGVRRPLNTVIGFSDLIASSAFGAVENHRYLEYARDIKTAGLEIAALVDELDDFARLRDGRYAARPTEIDLAVLLDSVIARVRPQASAARVLVRSAISERLPRIRADRASLAQAILNLLASAIDQTPQDGSVVLSAQPDDNGGVAINVRDSAHNVIDLGERFVVFRDGVGRDGETLTPIRSSVGLALTRALLDVNQTSLAVDPAGNVGTLFSLTIPPANTLLAKPGES